MQDVACRYDACANDRANGTATDVLVAQAAIERVHEADVPRLAERDVLPLDAGVLAPCEDNVTGPFGPLSLATAREQHPG